MVRPDAAVYIDLHRYPIDRPDSPDFAAVVARARQGLRGEGCAVLPGFVRRDVLAELVAEADRVAPAAYRSFNRTNAYFSKDDERLPPGHPVRRFYDRSNAFVPADNFGAESILRAIFEWPPFAPFIQVSLEEARFYRYADPLADVIVNLVEPGGGFPWHFDTNSYTITLAIQNGETGGAFEYCPNLRGPASENFDGVAAILDGAREGVRSLHLGGGDLQIFKGRYALHRVTRVGGARARYVAIFSFAEEPGMVGRAERMRQLYGRVLPVHLEREKARRADALKD